MTIPIHERTDRLQGYRGPVRELLNGYEIGVWSEVEIINDRGSSFVGVILPGRRANRAQQHSDAGVCQQA